MEFNFTSSIFYRLIFTLIFLIALFTPTRQETTDSIKITNEVELLLKNEFSVYHVEPLIVAEEEEEKSNVEKYLLIYLKSSNKNDYQVQLEIDSQNWPIDFSTDQCLFSLVYELNETTSNNNNNNNAICLESYHEIFEPNVTLKIKRHKLDTSISIRVRNVISGCSESTQLREIISKPNMPKIYHKSNNDCIYRITNSVKETMLNLTVVKFPSLDKPLCNRFVKVSGAKTRNDLTGDTQIIFDSYENYKQFNSSVYLVNKFSILRVANCYENTEPIEIEIEHITRNSFTGSDVKSFIVDSKEKMGDKKLNYFSQEIHNQKSNSKVSCFLQKYTAKQVNGHCRSKLIIYGVNNFNNLIWYNHSCNSLGLLDHPIEFKDIKTVYIQFNVFDDEHNDGSAQSIEDNDHISIQVDVKIINSIVKAKKYTKRSGSYSTRTKRDDYTNLQFDVEINTPVGTQIMFNLNEFNNAVEKFESTNLKLTKCMLNGRNACGNTVKDEDLVQLDSNDCSDYVLVKINKPTNRINSLYEENTNPKICNSIDAPQTFYSFTNQLIVTFSFSGQYLNGQKPLFSFNYTSKKFCDDTITNKLSDLIKYDSSKQVIKTRDNSCDKLISLPANHRIIFYRLYWKLNEKGFLFNEKDNNNNKQEVVTYNPKEKCLNSDTLVLNEQSKRHSQISLFEPKENYYCMDNPLNVYVTESNNLYLSLTSVFKKENSSSSSRPLVFETGYFGYKHLYDESDQSVYVDFSQLIPQDVTNSYPTSFSIRIKVSDNKYITPVISQCNTMFANGKVYIRSGLFENQFKMDCKSKSFTTPGLMSSELVVDFRNVHLTELRDNKVKFKIDYATLPRVMKQLTGSFESNNFTNQLLSVQNDKVAYEWKIEVDSIHFIQLNIDSLINKNAIKRLKISDNVIDLYEVDQINEKNTYLFASNKLKINLEYFTSIREENMPYVKISYKALPKVIQLNKDETGQIQIENVQTKDNLDWLMTAPKEYNILAKLKSYQGKGQLKFSLLNDGYKPTGSYHFDLNQQQQQNENQLSRATDFVISKSNQLRIQYFPSNVIDTFTLVYSSVKNILTEPFGIIKPFTNSDEIFSPKLTDQRWLIRAPYGKRINLHANRIDLYDEQPCSKASIKVYENDEKQNDRAFCGKKINTNELIDLESNYLVKSENNELNVKFVTHDADEAVFFTQLNGNLVPYEGFELVYVFEEQPGDCYFRQKHTICNYTSIGTIDWIVKQNNQITDEKESSFSSQICFNCYLKSQLHLEEETVSSSILVSPIVNKTKEYLKFNYKLTKGSRLLLKLVYSQDYSVESKQVKRFIYLNKLVSTDDAWKTGLIKIGKLFYNYRIVFELEKEESIRTNEPVTVGLDDIQFFEKDLECESNEFPDTCFISNQKKHEVISLQDEEQEEEQQDIKFCKKTVMPCISNKCALNSMCINLPDGYKCQCGFGYTGQYCDMKMNPCQTKWNNCSLNSNCIKSNDNSSSSLIDNLNSNHMNYECECKTNYYGKNCENIFTPCKKANNPCNQLSGHGVCIDEASLSRPNDFKCICSSLYTGVNCETKLEMQCSNNDVCRKFDKNATCIQFDDETFVCVCSSGYEGDLCTNINDCSDTVCLNNGKCLDGINNFTCKCDDKYTGAYCEQAKICSKCNLIGTVYCDQTKSECVCRETYSGEFCEHKNDLCMSDTCLNGATCYSNKTDQICLCKDGFKGKKCELPVDVCDEGHCLNGATCILNTNSNNTHGYECKCQSNFNGRLCELFTDPCHSHPCQNDATCFSYKDTYKCGCSTDWTGKNCDTKIDNCIDNKCELGSKCESLLATYVCICAEGRVGQYCQEHFDKCTNNKCKNGKCIPNYLSYNYTCECMPGYEGIYCENKIKTCNKDSNPCFNGGKCIDLLSKYECKCPQIFSNENCNRTEYCSLELTKCKPEHTERCERYDGGNKCICLPRYTGDRCEQTIDICEYERPCRSGVCHSINGTDEYECKNCNPGFTGKQCETMIDFCKLYPCQNSGVCLTKPNDYYCKCTENYFGKNCEQKIEIECLKHNCQHNSVCHPIKPTGRHLIGGYKCECDKHYEGLYCEKKVDLCKNKTCSYGYCLDGVCQCDPRFPYCKENSNCKNIQCGKGGTCIDVIVGDNTVSKCLCPPGITGENCELSHFCNDPEVCGKNPKKCKLFNNNYVCDCEKPLVGYDCQKNVSSHMPLYLSQLKEERQNKIKIACRFGTSRQSMIFIGSVIVFYLIFVMIAFLIGHRTVKSFKKKYLENSDLLIKRNTSVNSGDELITKSMIRGPMMYESKTPLSTYTNISRNEINKSGFSIPRPTVRIDNKSLNH